MVLFRGGLATLENAGFNREHWCRELNEVSQISWNLSWRLWYWQSELVDGTTTGRWPKQYKGKRLHTARLPAFIFSIFSAYFHPMVSKTCGSLKQFCLVGFSMHFFSSFLCVSIVLISSMIWNVQQAVIPIPGQVFCSTQHFAAPPCF